MSTSRFYRIKEKYLNPCGKIVCKKKRKKKIKGSFNRLVVRYLFNLQRIWVPVLSSQNVWTWNTDKYRNRRCEDSLFFWLNLIVSLADCVKLPLKSLERLCLNPKIRLGSEGKLTFCVPFVCLFSMLFFKKVKQQTNWPNSHNVHKSALDASFLYADI